MLPHRRIIRAYPKYTWVVLRQNDIKNSEDISKCLASSKAGVISSDLSLSGGYCLSMRLRTHEAIALLPFFCEHSEGIFIGKDYHRLICEHGRMIIPQNAVEVLAL